MRSHQLVRWNSRTTKGGTLTVLVLYGRSVKSRATVQAFDVLCEVQSDKACVEITSPFDGVLKEILVKEGEVAKVGEAPCLIETGDGEEVDSVETALSEGPAPVDSPSAGLTAVPPTDGSPQSAVQRRHHLLDPNKPTQPVRPSSGRLGSPLRPPLCHEERHPRSFQAHAW